ncbi:hypothetical protein CBE01nite_47860 [Clostridium beijerinckii]|nr:hypothetical protein CBE01nite_47860 [Clostridium beijerinckii]
MKQYILNHIAIYILKNMCLKCALRMILDSKSEIALLIDLFEHYLVRTLMNVKFPRGKTY